MCWCASCHPHGHPRCAVVRSWTLCSSLCSFPCVSLILSSSTWTLSWISSSMWLSSGQYTTGTPPNENSGPLAENTLLTYWKTWYAMVSEQTCTIDHKMDQSVWQTIISFDLSHSSYMSKQTILSYGKHCETMQVGTVSRLRFCGRSWGSTIYIRWRLFQSETNFSFAQFNRIRNDFLGRMIEVGRYTHTWFMGSDRRSSSRKHVSA